jgi:hypothetical protein
MDPLPQVPKRASRRARSQKARARKSVQQRYTRTVVPYTRASKHRPDYTKEAQS